jgi:hypothetical protein
MSYDGRLTRFLFCSLCCSQSGRWGLSSGGDLGVITRTDRAYQEPDYLPLPMMDVTPTQRDSIALVTIVNGGGTPQFAPTGSLQFSGYDWRVRMIANDKGGTNNLFDPENAWADARGALHMQIKKKSGGWSCAEIFLNRSLGDGTYSVTTRDSSHLEPAAVFRMFTFEKWAGDQHYSEVDRWGDAANKNNGQYVIQPFYNRPEVTKRGRARHVFVLESLLLVAPLTSDRDGDR